MKRSHVTFLVIGCSVIFALLFYAFRISPNKGTQFSDQKVQIKAKYPIGTSKSQLLLMLAKDKVDFGVNKNNTVGAIWRNVAGDFIVRESIHVEFSFDKKENLSAYEFKTYYTGP